MPPNSSLQIGLEHHRAGRLKEAEQVYRQVLAADADNPHALHLLGVLAHQVGKEETALQLILSAIGIRPEVPEFHANIGEAYRILGRISEAIASFRRALELRPDYAEAHNNLANALRESGNSEEALRHYQRALELEPKSADMHFNFANLLTRQDRPAEAVLHYRRALVLNPTHADAHNNLGLTLEESGDLEAAISCYRQALQAAPCHPAALANLGLAWHRQGRLEDAMTSYRQALALMPDAAENHLHLGNAFHDLGNYAEAVVSYKNALRLRPDFAEALANLAGSLRDQGTLDEALDWAQKAVVSCPDDARSHLALGHVYRDQGRLTEAIASFRRAVALEPESGLAHSTLVFTLHLSPDCDSQSIASELRQWNVRHALPLANKVLPHDNNRSPERRLRIGYVSPDFYRHPVGRFMLPLLRNHDHRDFEIFCYSSVRQTDPISEQCRACADVWRPARGMPDERLAELIRDDRIDILVDLTMHSAAHRLLVFARRPAPVQVTYLAYCGSTGLDAIDYRLSDPYLDPPGEEEPTSEECFRLPESYWCYEPLPDCPLISDLPARATKHVTFGCLNNFSKVTEPTLKLWCEIVAAVPDAHLLLHTKAGSHRQRVRALFAPHAVAPERLEFVDKVSLGDYFKLYEKIDIGLDPFPFAGGTTTCEALWMGVPVITLAGKTGVGRAGVSILSNVGLPEFVAAGPNDYVRIAVELAGDLDRLAPLRANLRDKMRASPLMDAPHFARGLEAAYRAMWQRWCKSAL